MTSTVVDDRAHGSPATWPEPVGSSFERLTTTDGLTYQPGLDGLRGLAVAAVVAFHLEISGVTGGYLGVSLFFTLSGVLIGTIVLNEIVSTKRFSLPAFWMRRARRLLPPALMVLAIVAAGRLVTASLDATSRADVVASALNVANWHLLAGGSSYADLSSGPSATLHFWSLAIEEQFYLASGLLAVLVATRARRPVLTVGLVAAGAAGVSFLAPIVLGFGVDRVYYGTDTRAGELMIGVAAAAVIVSVPRRHRIVAASGVVAVSSVAALAATALLWHVATPGTDALARGLLPLTALLSLLVIGGALVPSGPVAAMSQLPPLRWLGRISYGVYLIHWPVIVVANRLTDDRSVSRSAVLVAISLLLAQVSASFVERPTRRHRASGGRLAAVAALTLAAIGVATTFEGRATESADLLARLTTEPVPTVASTSPGSLDLPRLALFGDSVGFSMLLALGQSTTEPAFVRAPSDVNLGCGIALSPSPPPDQPGLCDDPAERFFQKAVTGEVSVAVMISCQWELIAQPIPGADRDTDRVVGDPDFDRYVRIRYEHVVDRLGDAGVERILWVTCPYLSQVVGVDGLTPRFRDSRNPGRVDRLNTIITEIADDRADVDVLAFDDWVNLRADDITIRPDGSHFEYREPNLAADAFVDIVNAALTAHTAPEG